MRLNSGDTAVGSQHSWLPHLKLHQPVGKAEPQRVLVLEVRVLDELERAEIPVRKAATARGETGDHTGGQPMLAAWAVAHLKTVPKSGLA